MHVTEVRFETFKSLYDVTCALDRFTVITGPNGAGKSNLVDAINFLGEVYEDGLEFAVGRAGGYENIAHRRTRRAKRPITVSVEVKVSAEEVRRLPNEFPWLRRRMEEAPAPADPTVYYSHSFTLATSSQALASDFRVIAERLQVRDAKGRSILKAVRNADGIAEVEVTKRRAQGMAFLREVLDPFTDPRFGSFLADRPMKSTTLLTEQFSYAGLLTQVKSALAGIRVFQLSPFQCRGSGVPTPNALLERHGENLPGAANHLVRNDSRAWNQVQNAMRDLLPGLQGIEIVYTEDRRLALQFRERGVGRPWNTNEVSDGTVQSLALFIALFDTRHPLLVIEEPENSIHPWILRRIVDLCQSKKSPKQIIMTSHSPVLLNYVNPSVVRLMSIKNGRSSIAHFLEYDPDLRGAITDGYLSLFDAYDSGDIQQAVPRGLAGSPDAG